MATTDQTLPPEIAEVERRKGILEAVQLIGSLYVDLVRVSQEPLAISNEALNELGKRVGREGMAAGRRLRKAAGI